ncbi:DUF262 domain-containing protein [Meridianimarinicoccus aquatilis]|uniref:DUF262 domain-containing protein n=1 Tax=Meridianimarinicoccus aquatilis TaxID=2552766 RepID=A0A4R6ALS9_9RHOB|nr:DUF262 domain-containing protein [Fluviibacterium aquatile]TDL84385.1 DUF262 domain-containing protein [Fluviibacterium aquatile]
MNEEIAEIDKDAEIADPDATFPPNRDVVTQNYDLVVGSLMQQIESSDIVLRPSFQRGYVWSNATASRLIESVILNVPIPPCYLSQNDDFELDVIDGQQRLQSIYRFTGNQFALSSLAITKELNGLRFHQLPTKIQRQIKTHTIRCVMITNKSHSDVKFDIFERLNSNTSTLNAQELRNCIYRGDFNDLLRKIAERPAWLKILGRKVADKRMKGEETILRHFAFKRLGLATYRTPLRNWLNDAAEHGRKLPQEEMMKFDVQWEHMISVSTAWFDPSECFRRPKSKPINKALFDLVALAASEISMEKASASRDKFRETYFNLLENEEFEDLISRAVDHKKRTERRFALWQQSFDWLVN